MKSFKICIVELEDFYRVGVPKEVRPTATPLARHGDEDEFGEGSEIRFHQTYG
ncbi:MAG: hypothetical protein ACLQSR_07350 [Limisphaerales bacterium]